jgi:muramoyltetrapeptide carboxypeptidase
LRPGARVALVAPAGPLDAGRVAAAEERCRSLGFVPLVGANARGRDGFLAGPDQARLDDLQRAFDDPTVDAVWALRGGYGTGRIVDGLDLTRQVRDPIPFVGFSDNTALHARHTSLGVVSFHGPHPTGRDTSAADAWFQRVLMNTEPPGPLPLLDSDTPRTLVPGRAEGRLVGGNLSLLASMCGTRDTVAARGRILVLEDVGEPAYRVDRMLVQLRRSGVLEGVSALACGRFTASPEGDAEGVIETLRRFAESVAVPAVVDLPFGHVRHNCVLPLGARAVLDADAGALDIVESAVS